MQADRAIVQMDEIRAHPWVTRKPPRLIYGVPPPAPPDVNQIARPVGSVDEIDPEILGNLRTLWQGAGEREIVQELLSPECVLSVALLPTRNPR